MRKSLFILSLAFGISAGANAQTTYTSDQVDLAPLWVGCSNADCTAQKIAEFIGANMQYPPYAKENGIADKVFVKFTVFETGRVGNVSIQQSNGTMLDREAGRVINSIPPMAPAVKNGQNVAVQYVVPVWFKLD